MRQLDSGAVGEAWPQPTQSTRPRAHQDRGANTLVHRWRKRRPLPPQTGSGQNHTPTQNGRSRAHCWALFAAWIRAVSSHGHAPESTCLAYSHVPPSGEGPFRQRDELFGSGPRPSGRRHGGSGQRDDTRQRRLHTKLGHRITTSPDDPLAAIP